MRRFRITVTVHLTPSNYGDSALNSLCFGPRLAGASFHLGVPIMITDAGVAALSRARLLLR